MSRRLALLAAPALLLAACGDKQPAAVNQTAGDAGLEQENVIAGDVTAIDAATADDSRMANDMAPPLDLNELGPANEANASGNNEA
jgi:hypothetical protein